MEDILIIVVAIYFIFAAIIWAGTGYEFYSRDNCYLNCRNAGMENDYCRKFIWEKYQSWQECRLSK